jgi:AcrR family transcriptional regulator
MRRGRTRNGGSSQQDTPREVVSEEPPARTRQRGEARRAALLHAAQTLLEELAIDKVTFRAVCERAGVPESSAYYFFPDLRSVYRALLNRLGSEHDAAILRPFRPSQRETWQDLVRTAWDRSVAFQRKNPVFAKLTISGQVPFDLKEIDRSADRHRAQSLLKAIDEFFVLPRIKGLEEIFYVGAELADLVLTLSMVQHNALVPEMVERAKVAMISFVAHYTGANLERRPDANL